MKCIANALCAPKRAFRFLPLALGMLLFALGGCGNRNERADIVFINGGEPETLDPAVAVGQLDGRVSEALFDGLMQFDPQTGDAVPGLAERFDLSPDGLTYTFHLRTNAAWSTGEPITAHDFVYSWRRVLNPETASDYAGQLFYVRNAEGYCTGKTNPATGRRFTAEEVAIRAPDAHTFVVELIAPTSFFPDLCAFHTLAVVPEKAVKKYGDRWVRGADTPFSGAFTLESWRVNDRIRVRRNPNYWNAAEVRITTADFLPQSDPTFSLNAFLRGDVDVIFDKRRVPAELLDVLREQPFANRFDYLCTFFYRYNVTKKPFDDPRVRQALAMAVDKKRIVERITRGGERPATHLTPPGIRGYGPPPGLEHNPERARQLLKEAGYPEGQGFPVFRYLTQTSVQTIQTAVELREMWERELGIRMEIKHIEWKVFQRDQSQTNYDVSSSSWIGDYKDPNTFLDLFLQNNGNNRTGWANARYDALLREANSQVDPAKRWQLLREAETILVRNEVPIAPLYFEKGILFFDPEEIGGLHGNMVDQHPLSDMHRLKPPSKGRTVKQGNKRAGL